MGQGNYRQNNTSLNACAFEDYVSTLRARFIKLEDEDDERASSRVTRVLVWDQNAGKVMDSLRDFKDRNLFTLT